MSKNDSFTPQNKNGKNRQIVTISILIMALLFVADVYVMINMPNNYAAFGVITIWLLLSVYFFINAMLKEMESSNLAAKEQRDSILKSGKASYIMLKKVSNGLDSIEGNTRKTAEDIITAQKAIAKVTISRNKENADAMMNSNDKVMERFFEFQESFDEIQSQLLDTQRNMLEESAKEQMTKQDELASGMRDMEESIKSELIEALNSIQEEQSKQITLLQQELNAMREEVASQIASISIPQPSYAPQAQEAAYAVEEEMPVYKEDLASEDFGITESALSDEISLEEPITSEKLDFGTSALEDDLGVSESALEDDLGISESALDEDLGVSESAIDEDLGIVDSVLDDLGISESALDDDLGVSESAIDEDLGIVDSVLEDLGISESALDEDLGVSESAIDEDLGMVDSVLDD